MTIDIDQDREWIVDGDYEAVYDLLSRLGVTDGLPVVPPTHARVDRMVGTFVSNRERVLGVMPPRGGAVTVGAVAANAVMAGLPPAAFPVVLQAVVALMDPKFNLLGIQTTTNPVTAMVVVNGPVRQALGLNAGTGALGPGTRANATIGRAVRLSMMNLGGAWPGRGDASTLASPTKYGLCLAENEEESPWGAAHVEWGYPPDTSSVTVLPAAGPQGVIHIGARSDPDGLLGAIVRAVASAGSNAIFFPRADLTVVLAPEIARTLAQAGHTRDSIRRAIAVGARVPFSFLPPGSVAYLEGARPDAVGSNATGEPYVRCVDSPSRVHVLVAGGPGGHAALFFGFNASERVTRRLDQALPATA